MKVRSHYPLLAALLLLGCFAQAQTSGNRSVVQGPPRPAPATITPARPGPSVTNAAGLPSPSPAGSAVNNSTAKPAAGTGAGSASPSSYRAGGSTGGF